MAPAMAQAPAPADTLAIEHATVLPMDRDTALADHTVLVAAGRVLWVGPASAAPVPATARRVDARGAFLLPGLADMHVHLLRPDDLARYVAAGVTTVRNMNGEPVHLAWRAEVAAGTRLGPRIYTAGPPVRRSFGAFWRRPMRTAAEAEALVQAQHRAGYDMIKVQNAIGADAHRALVAAARRAGRPVVGHVAPEVGFARSLAHGQASFEHAEYHLFDGDGDGTRLDAGAAALARARAWVGTIISDRDGRCALPTAEHRRVIAALRRAGVRLLAGTDASLGPLAPGAALHCELASLVAAGLTPYEALVTATRHAGDFAREQLGEPVAFGTVAAGAAADLVLLPADPRHDIRALVRPLGTVLRGRWLPGAAAP